MGRARIRFTEEEKQWIIANIRYDGRTIRWRVDINSRARKGEVAGSGQGLSRSMIGIAGRKVYASSVAWFLIYKRDIPEDHNITFRNGDPTDLRKCNLVSVPISVTGFGITLCADYYDHVVKTPEGKWKAFTLSGKKGGFNQHLRFIGESYINEHGLVKYKPLLYPTRDAAVSAAIKATKRGGMQLSLWGRPLKSQPQSHMRVSNGTLRFKGRTA